jgi:hypothetical protein
MRNRPCMAPVTRHGQTSERRRDERDPTSTALMSLVSRLCVVEQMMDEARIKARVRPHDDTA